MLLFESVFSAGASLFIPRHYNFCSDFSSRELTLHDDILGAKNYFKRKDNNVSRFRLG